MTYDATIKLASSGVMLISSTAIIGWWVDHAVLAEWMPGIADMTFNTALCFMFMAIAGFNVQSRTISVVMGLSIGFLGFLSLSQDVFGFHLGIDNVFFDSHHFGLTSPHPGRMSPNTSLGFLLISITLIAMVSMKAKGFLSTMIHAFIMLLGLLALVGISMKVLVLETPTGFEHFASMSLYTAILFLLSAVSLLSIHAKTYQYVGINALLYSSIHLMYSLKYPQKFALVSIVMLVPLGFLMVDKLNDLNRNAEEAKLKIVGINHLLATSKLLQAIPEHRGMVNATLASPGTFGYTLQQKTAEIDMLFSINDAMDKKYVLNMAIPDEWIAIKKRWKRIKLNHHDSVVSWQLHTEIIAHLSKHLRDIGSVTRLSYDGDPMIHNLMAAQLEVLPALSEKIGQLRGQGAGFIAKKFISSTEQVILGSKTSEILLLLRELDQLLTYALRTNHHEALERLHATFSSLTHQFLVVAERQLISGKKMSMSSEQYFEVASRALRAGSDFNHDALSFLNKELLKRINESITTQYTIKLSAVLILLLILYLFWGFYQSVMNTIDALGDAVQRMRDGDMDEIAGLPTNDEMGGIVDSFNVIADELMKVSLHMRAVVNHTVDGIITIDHRGIIKSFNPAAEMIFGYGFDEVIEQNIMMLMSEKYRERHQVGLHHYFQIDSASSVDIPKPLSVHGLMKDGSEFPLELSISTMVIDDQRLFIGMVRDVSNQKQLEKQLLHAQKMEAIGALVGGVAHNFNNLLAGIIGKAFLAKMNLLKNPEEATQHLESIEKISLQAGDMVKQLLTFSHKDFFREEQDTPLAPLIIEGFKTGKLGISEDIDLSLNIMVEKMHVRCDANQVQQVLMNMLNNARDALMGCAEKRISVTLDAVTPSASFFQKHVKLSKGEYACLTISDTGHGMDDDTMQKIFDPFYTTKEVGVGTGLGLSSAFGCIATHRGVIDVESNVGIGTTFRVYLPTIQSKKTMPDVQGTQTIVPSLHHETVLLVDDEALILESIREVLEDLGYKVLTAENGQEGLACFRRNRDDIGIVITDVVMPSMGGVAMFREIRKINGHIPFVFVTGYDGEHVNLDDHEIQTSTVLLKPIHISELSQVLQSVCQSR